MPDNRDKKALVSIEDVTGLSRPVTKLIDVVASATGILYEPTRIRRKAKADRDAQIIAAETRFEISEIERRGLERLVREEGRKQQNIEAVIDKAIPEIDIDAKPETIDADWLMHFMDNVKKISNEEVQDIWSKILSREANSPGKFSKKTLTILSELSQREAKLFELICRFFVISIRHPLVFSASEQIYIEHGLNFSTLKRLEEYGLIEYNWITGFQLDVGEKSVGKPATFRYFDSVVGLSSMKSSLPIGQVRLTDSGQELQSIVHVEPIRGFVEYIAEKWNKHGATVLMQK